MAEKEIPQAGGNNELDQEIIVDAVCAKCGAVSPEGTMICKTCGNNLRDQRRQRLAGGPALGAPALARPQSRWLSKAFAVLGILIVIWVALHVDQIEELLIILQTPTGPDADRFWSDAGNEIYAELLAELETHPITEEEREQALAETHSNDSYDGRYVLMQDRPFGRRRDVGEACAKRDGDRLFFVANLLDNVEMRGEAWFEDPDQPVAWETAALRMEGKYYLVTGFAVRRNAGIFECYGQSYHSDSSFLAMAYRVPAPGEFQALP